MTAIVAKPEILAPAGNREAFLAAIAAGADAIYCGLKQFSARMAADNFTMEELARLTELAHGNGVRVYIALNTLIKPDEQDAAAQLVDRLQRCVGPDALILQDLGFLPIAGQVGYTGELHLSTLANASFADALQTIKRLKKIQRVVIPRELHVDEIRTMAAACPGGMGLEVFIHGALCYGVSGRCYWSSYMGGKSGLRGRCVQPCRRMYDLKGRKKRYFSCSDFSLDVLAKVLLSEKSITAWKIEGRKKGPHYVYNTVTAYRLFRDHAEEPAMKKEALFLLETALGRQGSHYNFLPQRPQIPIATDQQTGSGLMVGKIKGPGGKGYITPNTQLLAGDLLRIGYEDEAGHTTYRVTKSVPKRGKLTVNKPALKSGMPVFLMDRREPDLAELIRKLTDTLEELPNKTCPPAKVTVTVPPGRRRTGRVDQNRKVPQEMNVVRIVGKTRKRKADGFWLSAEAVAALPGKAIAAAWCWLPPVIWPEGEPEMRMLVQQVIRKGCTRFVLNAPWQVGFFTGRERITIWAGPFCNISNSLAINVLAGLGFAGVIVSPELSREDYQELARQSVLPVGIVLSGSWPLCVSRILSEEIHPGQTMTSPKQEDAWSAKYDATYWLFPNWKLDLLSHKRNLQQYGFSLFVHLEEPIPREVRLKKRQGIWNWQVGLR